MKNFSIDVAPFGHRVCDLPIHVYEPKRAGEPHTTGDLDALLNLLAEILVCIAREQTQERPC